MLLQSLGIFPEEIDVHHVDPTHFYECFGCPNLGYYYLELLPRSHWSPLLPTFLDHDQPSPLCNDKKRIFLCVLILTVER